MILKRLNLLNFRNYPKLDLDFSSPRGEAGQKPTIFIGPNGAGKSNILEAIYLLSTTKSPRAENEGELIKNEEVASSVKGKVEDDGEVELMVTMVGATKDIRFTKRVFLNGVARRVIDFIGVLPAVIFWPSDINSVTGSPSLRRWHTDLSIAQADQKYKRSLTLFGDVLVARNKVLKRINEGQGRVDELTYF